MNAKVVRDILAPLDGQSFESREDVETAVFPLWAKSPTVLAGEGHRDLVDRLIRARWVDFVQGKWKFFLPNTTELLYQPQIIIEKESEPLNEKFVLSVEPSDWTPSIEIEVSDVQLLVSEGVKRLINLGLLQLTTLGLKAKSAKIKL